MDPELAVVLAGGLLAVLGVRRRRRAAPDSPTVGQQITDRGLTLSRKGASLLRDVGSTATSVTIGTGEVAVAGASLLAAGVVRTGARASIEVAALGVGVAGQVATGAGGLLVDGVLGVRDDVTGAFGRGRRRPSDDSESR
jgi:hypothetical protein